MNMFLISLVFVGLVWLWGESEVLRQKSEKNNEFKN